MVRNQWRGFVAVGSFAMLAACGGSSKNNGNNDGGGNQNDGSTNQNDGSTNQNDGSTNAGVTCSTGSLFAGSATYDGDPSDRPTSGTGVLANPPLQWQSLVFSGTHLYTRQEGEIWSVDLSASALVETKIAGSNPSGSTYPFNANNVACSAATFTQLRGLTALSDGSLVATDLFANSIIKVTHPNDVASCNVTVIAGNATVAAPIDPSDTDTYPPSGQANGTGTAASFNNLKAAIADSSDNVYLVDNTSSDGEGHAVLRKITSAGVVTTALTMPSNDPPTGPETLENFAYVGSTLYAASRNANNQGYVISIDPTAGTFATIAGGGGSAWDPVDSASSPQTSGIASDGTGLFVAGAGYVWYVTTAGNVKLVAGTGVNIDNFTSDYDPTMSHPALMLQLPTTIGPADQDGTSAIAQLGWKGGAVYYRGFASGTQDFVEKIACQ